MEAPVSQVDISQAATHDVGPHWQRRYWAIFIGQALSMIGSAMTQFVLLWWITTTTQSATALATAGMAALVPQALLGPLGGTFADRYSRRLLMIGADLICALCMVVLIVLFATNSVQLWHIYTLMFVRSSMQAFQTPAASASTAMLVPPEFLPRAAGLNQTLGGIMTIAAAPLGALAMAVMPLSAALSIDVVTAILGIAPLLVYAIPQQHIPKEDRQGMWTEFREGVDVVWSNRGLRHLYGLLGVTVLVLMPTFTMVPLLIKQYFDGGAGHVAIMEGLAGAGMIAGGLFVAAVNPKRRIITTLAAFALCCLALAFTALAPANAFWLAVTWWAISGLTFSYGNAPMVAVLQSVVPNHLQGRAFSLLSTIMGLASPFGLALAGPLAEIIGVRWVFVLSGVLGAVVSLLGFFSHALRNLEKTNNNEL
jgi:DHA3 family macrolide efflux protein-like MFS transporter